MNLARYCLADAAARAPDKTALLVARDASGIAAERWSFSELEDAVLRVAGGLATYGFEAGDRVLLRLGNSSDFPLFFFGAIAAGLVAVPTSPMLTRREVDAVLADSGARLIVADKDAVLPTPIDGVAIAGSDDIARIKAATPQPYAESDDDDPAFLVFTSGTSGHPKGVLHAQRSARGRAPMYDGWYGLRADDVLLHAGAFNWTYTLGAGLMDPWANGATAVIYAGKKDPTVWPQLITAYRATLFAAVPSLYRQILKYCAIGPDDMPTLRHGLTAGEALRPALHREWAERTGRPLYEALGMSEVSTYISSSPTTPTRPGSPGRRQHGRRVIILPEDDGCEPLPAGVIGVIAVHNSDPGLMLGYWQQPAETRAAFRGDWFVTGDRARFDEDGYLWFEGRGDDLMNTFGYRVAPEEVEAALAAHPDVAEVAVIDTRVDDLVRIITAFVVPRTAASLEDAELTAWCATRLAAYKCPRRFVHVTTLPRTPSGKVRRKDLRELA
ncbi:MAG: acyl--CoA ligase [Hyphomicrobiales bacterium]|nr:acyl--CoA ligase [Hyphomicrobiales bacterium]